MDLKRLIIYDPSCYGEGGHNARSCKLFCENGKKIFDNVKVLHSGGDKYIETLSGIDQEGWLNFYYKSQNKNYSSTEIFTQAENDLQRALAENENSVIFVISCDFYIFSAICQIAKFNPNLLRSRLKVRFIGLYEHETISNKDEQRFFEKFSKNAAFLHSIGITFSAETKVYATYLSQISKVFVEVCPYPIMFTKSRRNFSALQKPNPLKIGIIGEPRREKGYFNLASLASKISDKNLNVELIFQKQDKSNAEFDESYSAILERSHNIKFLPSYLTLEEMERALDNVHYQLLFYEPSKYYHRGSAMLYEAIKRFCPVLALSKNAFAREVKDFGLGYVFASESELIKKLSDLPNKHTKTESNIINFSKWAEKQTIMCMRGL